MFVLACSTALTKQELPVFTRPRTSLFRLLIGHRGIYIFCANLTLITKQDAFLGVFFLLKFRLSLFAFFYSSNSMYFSKEP